LEVTRQKEVTKMQEQTDEAAETPEQELERLRAQDHWHNDAIGALAIEQRRVALWALPVVGDAEVPFMLRMADSTYQATKASDDPPPVFFVGRRAFAKPKDLLRWVDARAKAGLTPISKADEREVSQAIRAAELRRRSPRPKPKRKGKSGKRPEAAP
jgi:hypothetical protein